MDQVRRHDMSKVNKIKCLMTIHRITLEVEHSLLLGKVSRVGSRVLGVSEAERVGLEGWISSTCP